MKKLLFGVMVALLSIFSWGGDAQAQSSSPSQSMFEKKRFFKSASNLTDADMLALEDIKWTNVRMHYDFTNRYKGATNIQLKNEDYFVYISCSTDGVFNRIRYNRKGRWQSAICTYHNEKLDKSIRAHIEDLYPRYTIFGSVIEVLEGSKTAHLVTIQDKRTWKRIKVVEGYSEVYEEYNKAQ